MLSHTYSVICYSALGEDMLVLDFEGGYAQEAVQFSFFFFITATTFTIIHEGGVNIFEEQQYALSPRRIIVIGTIAQSLSNFRVNWLRG